MSLIQKNLTNHIIVAGYGTSGAEAVEELLARGTRPEEIVIVDTSPAAIDRAEQIGCNVYQGDATRDKILEAVRIGSARSLVISAGRDDTSILIALTARHLAKNVRISITVRAEDNELLARQAGANVVINPASFAGLLLAGSCHGEHMASYLSDLASSGGRVQLSERSVAAGEVGKPLASITSGLGVRIYRDGRPFGFWEEAANALQEGDLIVEIVEGTGRPRQLGQPID